jgi:hypothetical protein
MIGGVHGPEEANVFKELCQVVDEWIKIHEAEDEPLPPKTAGRDYSGKFVLRVGKELHKTIALDAMRSGKSINSYCVDLLEHSRPIKGKAGKRRSRTH